MGNPRPVCGLVVRAPLFLSLLEFFFANFFKELSQVWGEVVTSAVQMIGRKEGHLLSGGSKHRRRRKGLIDPEPQVALDK